MKNEILNSLDVIQETCNETEVAVAEAIIQECYKAMDILGYSDTDVDQFNIIQEGKIMDDVKKQGEGQSKVMRILSFIPRLLAALFKAVSGKLSSTAEKADKIGTNMKKAYDATKNKKKVTIDERPVAKKFIDGMFGETKGMKIVSTGVILGIVTCVAGYLGYEALKDKKDEKYFKLKKSLWEKGYDKLSDEEKEQLRSITPGIKKLEKEYSEIEKLITRNEGLFKIEMAEKFNVRVETINSVALFNRILIRNFVDNVYELPKDLENYEYRLSRIDSTKNSFKTCNNKLSDDTAFLLAVMEVFEVPKQMESYDKENFKDGYGSDLIKEFSADTQKANNKEVDVNSTLANKSVEFVKKVEAALLQSFADLEVSVTKLEKISEIFAKSVGIELMNTHAVEEPKEKDDDKS